MNSWKLWLFRTVDTNIGKLLVLLLAPLKKVSNKQPKPIKSIVVIRLWAIGESILALPAISAIKQAYPAAKITVITTPYVAPIFYKQVSIDDVHIIKPNILSLVRYTLKHWRKFDIIVDFEPYLFVSAVLAWAVSRWPVGFATRGRQVLYSQSVNYNDQQHVVHTNLDLVRKIGVFEKHPHLPTLNYSARDQDAVDSILSDKEIGKQQRFILVAPGVGGSAPYRMWSWRRFAALADQLIDMNKCQIVWIGEKNDRLLIKKIQETMKLDSIFVTNMTLNQLFYFVSQARLLIANDSGIMHIGAAMKTSTLGLFGPNTPVRFGPFGENNRSIYHQVEGSPCINVHKGEIPRKNKQCTQAIKLISINEVYDTIRQML